MLEPKKERNADKHENVFFKEVNWSTKECRKSATFGLRRSENCDDAASCPLFAQPQEMQRFEQRPLPWYSGQPRAEKKPEDEVR
jgi:hypothetical protein